MKEKENRYLSRFLAVCLLFLLFSWYVKALQSKIDNDETRKISKKVITVENKERNIFLSSSASRLKDKSAPLIVFLHGMDGAWPNKKFTRPQYDFINSLAWKYNFIAVFPQGTEGSCDIGTDKYMFYYCWDFNNKKDVSYIKKIKETLIAQYGVDPNKAFLIGFSNGGYFVSDYLIKDGTGFTGYGIHASGTNFNKIEQVKSSKNNLISLSVGLKDEFQLKEMRSLKKQFINSGWQLCKNILYQEYVGAHEMSKLALSAEIEFFLNKKACN